MRDCKMEMNASLWRQLSASEKEILIQAAMIMPPVSFDVLFHTLSSPPTTALKAVEKFLALNIFLKSESRGSGFFSFKDPATSEFILQAVPEKDADDNGKRLIEHYVSRQDETCDSWLQIAHIYRITKLKVRHAAAVIKAADYCMENNLLKDAFAFYYLIVSDFSREPASNEDRDLYVRAAVGLCANSEDLLPLSAQERIISKALDCIQKETDPSLHVLALIFKARCMMRQGDFKGADLYYSQAISISRDVDIPSLKSRVFAYHSDIQIWRGHIRGAVLEYEKLVGDLETIPSDALFLKAFSRLGWSYGIHGDIYRGLGLVSVVQKKAKELRIRYIEIYSELMKLMILTDARRITEARACLEIMFEYPESELDHYVLWAIHGKKAFFEYLDGDLDAAYRSYQKSMMHSRTLECPHYHGTDILEYLYAFEKEGMEEGVFQKELQKIIQWPDIYTRGAALRYRAVHTLAAGGSEDDVIKDFEKSLVLLQRAGADVELARTQITMAGFLLNRNPVDMRSRTLLKNAWKITSVVNPELFPDGLKSYVEEQDQELLLVDTIVEVGNTLSQTRDRFELLSRIIRLVIKMVGAERGGIFLLNETGGVEMGASRNLEAETIGKEVFQLSLEVIQRVIDTGKENISFGRFAALVISGKISKQGWVICYPITLKDRILGAIYLDNSFSSMRLSRHRLPLLKAIGNQIAISLDNVEAYEKITRLQYRLEAETHFYRTESHKPEWARHIVGESRAIRQVLDIIKEVAHTDATVLIYGETGVGKELAARAVHDISNRADGPFIPINVATISPDLVYSELFGHVRGAFTGAHHSHVGRFELANGGSFFMDDVDGLTLETQIKLLRVLETREFQRVGDHKVIRSDFRLIAATNQDLTRMVRQGTFRSDLYYRLNVVPVTIPPLRDRKEDIPLLVAHFLRIFSRKAGRPVPGVSKDDMDRMMDYSWPGNVRELSHFIERSVILSRGEQLKIPGQDLLIQRRGERMAFPGLNEMIRQHVEEALRRCHWRVSGKNGAAELLKMKPQTLYSKINALGIKQKPVRSSKDEVA